LQHKIEAEHLHISKETWLRRHKPADSRQEAVYLKIKLQIRHRLSSTFALLIVVHNAALPGYDVTELYIHTPKSSSPFLNQLASSSSLWETHAKTDSYLNLSVCHLIYMQYHLDKACIETSLLWNAICTTTT